MLDPEKERKLIEMWNRGVPVAEISKVLGIRRSLVSAYARVLGLPPRRPTKVDPEEVRRLWEAGLSLQEIAEELGVDVSTVKNYLRAMGLRRRFANLCSRVDVEQLRKLCEEGLSDEEIARRLGTSKWCIARLRRRYGIRRLRPEEREVLRAVEEKGFVTSAELRERGIKVTRRMLRSLELYGIDWFRLVRTSTAHTSVFTAQLSNLTIIYKRGQERSVARFLLQNIRPGVSTRAIKAVLKSNNVPQEVLNALESEIRGSR